MNSLWFYSPCQSDISSSWLQIAVWDTAGVERFRTLTRNYYRNADATVFVYSVTDTSSLHYLTQWLKDAQLHAPNALRVIVGNKIDLHGSIEVEEPVAQAFANLQKINLLYRISCKSNEGVENMVTSVTREIHKRALSSEPAAPDESTLKLGQKTSQDPSPDNQRGCKC